MRHENDKTVTLPAAANARVLFQAELQSIHRATDRLFLIVLLLEWLVEMGLSIWFSPRTWVADTSSIHPHVWQATVWGGVVISLPCLMSVQHAGLLSTRLAISAAQAVSSGLLIHLMNGRIESHFHVFVSLALLAFYRDWNVLFFYSSIVALDHLMRGIWLPYSVYGTELSDPWRFLEHIGWVVIEVGLLLIFCNQNIAEMWKAADRQARFEYVKARFESEVIQRTESFRLNEERTELALRGSKIGIYDWDLKSGQLYVSAQVDEILGIVPGKESHTFESLTSRLHPDEKEGVLAAIDKAVRKDEPFQREFRLLTEVGDYVWVECRGESHTNFLGRVYRFAGGVKDITARKQLEAQSAERDAKSRNSQKLEAVGSLAGGIAHEFNNLLQAIRGFTEIIVESLSLEDQRRQDLQQVLLASDRAASLTRQLLGFSRQQSIERRNLRAEDIVHELIHMIRPIIGEQIQISTELSNQLGTISADPVLIQQMLLNLCINARDAMPNGGNLKVSASRVKFSSNECDTYGLKATGPYLHLAIADNGTGIAPEIRLRIFEPFFTTKEVGKGTGLGLSMVYGVVKEHDGAIHVDSTPGYGTTFHVYLPICQESAIEVHRPANCCHSRGSETILLAEDEVMVRTLISRLLNDVGYRVLTAADGEEAIDVFTRNQDKISLVVLDAVMPRLSGHEVFRNLRLIDPEISIIYCSGYDPLTRHLQFELDQDICVVEKPFETETLLRTVREALDRRCLEKESV